MTRTEVYLIQVFAGFGAFVLGAAAIILAIKSVELKITEANIAAAETKPVVLVSQTAGEMVALSEIARSGTSKSAQAKALMDMYGEGK